MNVIQQLEQEQQKEKVPALRAGDSVKVHAKVVEGTRERIQVFEGTVIRVTGGGLTRLTASSSGCANTSRGVPSMSSRPACKTST